MCGEIDANIQPTQIQTGVEARMNFRWGDFPFYEVDRPENVSKIVISCKNVQKTG